MQFTIKKTTFCRHYKKRLNKPIYNLIILLTHTKIIKSITKKFTRKFATTTVQLLACKVFKTQLSKAEVSISSVIQKDCKRVAVLIKLGSSNDPQVLQRQVVKLVQSHQHIARHFSYRLLKELGKKVLMLFFFSFLSIV